ncbi:unnamed protein product [Didymodactylos carnosus]|uniref:RRM domain-containing protein n=1 Tax=Didymodactylos carnosus TaxID=1234261 RepID=A0A813WJ46_9BILA|nr:unnamed protein product [Didymodactylos carnosus]CAF0856148.1 unnamed protein product [Didymodactylos carnosus]CAF3545144.1 unnamed protein product [Didymodactylos carnosus]CAF3643911.1 unnamed protein product [Didymodactylos carnosus]
MSVEEKQARSVFVGNIPHGTTEDQMKEIFSVIGPVLSFRIVYDRETGNPKGYGFAEYQDIDMAQSAIRNLNGFEFGGRTLRVDKASSQADELRLLHQQTGGPPFESAYGANVSPEKVPEVIARTIANLPPEQVVDLMKHMQIIIKEYSSDARNILIQNPQLTYAMLQAMVIMGLIQPSEAINMLHKRPDVPQILPIIPNQSITPIGLLVPNTLQSMHIRPSLPVPNPTLSQSTSRTPFTTPPPVIPPPLPPPPPFTFNQPPIPPIGYQSPVNIPIPPPPLPQSHVSPGGSVSNMSRTDHEKAHLLMQVLQLSDAQIAQLPPDQRTSIMLLKEQIAKSGHGPPM